MKKSATFHPRLTETINQTNIWLKGEKEFSALFTGPAGCGKTNFIQEYLESLNLNYIYCNVPDEGSYLKEVESKVSAYESSFTEFNELEMLKREQGEKSNPIEHDAPYVIIDESHHFIGELERGAETFQHGKKSLKVGEVFIPYNRLIFISHEGIGDNNSSQTRFTTIEVPPPSRKEIVEILRTSLKFSKEKAEWSAAYSKGNFRSAIDTSHAFGTPAQSSYLPRGLSKQDVEVLWYYFRTDSGIKTQLISQSDLLIRGTNTLGNCAAFLGLDPNAIKKHESNLKEEGILSTGTQSKRIIVTNETSYKLTLAILKFSGKFANPETEKPKAQTVKEKGKPKKTASKTAQTVKEKQPSKAQTAKQPSKAKEKPIQKPVSKSKAKQAKQPSKTDTVKPDKTPSQLQAEIASQIVKPFDKLEMVGNME